MHFDGTITLGSIFSAVTIVGAIVVFFVRLVELQRSQNEMQANQSRIMEAIRLDFKKHEDKDDLRFERLENRVIDLVAGLQRMVGNVEVFRLRPRGGEKD